MNVIFVFAFHDNASEVIKISNYYIKRSITQPKVGLIQHYKMYATYNVSRNRKRLPVIIFFTLLNVGDINTQIIYHGNQLELHVSVDCLSTYPSPYPNDADALPML